MYRVVIIDDEPIIVTGLSKIVPWEKYRCEVVGIAYDGREGLEVIRRERPDIVFSDIYMPRMDGLLMMAALKSEFEDMELAVLTGYRDFELVQKALNLGVTRFLLKPSNMEELEEAVAAMTAKLARKGIFPEKTGLFADHPDESPVTGNHKSMNERENTGAGTDSPEAGSFIVNTALEFMRKNYDRKLTLKEVADNTYVSQWHLSKLLNRHTGQSFSEILNSVRIEEAKKLLKDPALRIGDVAEKVGFLDMGHFSRVFKKMTGISANEYRNRMK